MAWNDGDIESYSQVMKACLKLTKALSKLDQDSPEIKRLQNLVRAPYGEEKLKSQLIQNQTSWADLMEDIGSAFNRFAYQLETLFAEIASGAENRSEEYYIYRNTGRQFWGHAADFWGQRNKKKDNLSNKECLAALQRTLDLLPQADELQNQSKVLEKLKPIISKHWEMTHSVELSEKQLTGLISRIISNHRDSAAVQFLSLKETIENQLNMIQWKDYVPASGSWMKEKKPALEHLKDWRKEQEPVLQVTGDGGLGKTKLIYEFLKACIEEDEDTESFDTYIFLTAKSKSQGEFNTDYRTRTDNNVLVTSPRDPTVAVGQYIPNLSYDTCVEYYKAVFGVSDKDELKDCFNNQRVMVILDNFEDVKVPDIAHHLKFIKKFLPAGMKSKFLITGRADADDAKDYGIGALKLDKLTRKEASELVHKRYRYLFEKQYADRGLTAAPIMDLRKAFEDLTSRNELIETIGIEIGEGSKTARAFKLGQHHPMVLFWVISLLMDPKIFDEAEGLLLNMSDASEGVEVDIKEKNAVTMFKFVIEHEQYGLQTFIHNWEAWIREKSTVYLENDPTCMLIITYLAKNKTELIDDVHIYAHLETDHDIEEEPSRRALAKILAQPDVLEQDTDYPKYRITKKALATFKLELDEDTDVISKTFSNYANEFHDAQVKSRQLNPERIEGLLDDIRLVTATSFRTRKQAIAVFKAITFCSDAIRRNKSFPQHLDDLKLEVTRFFTLLKNMFIPNPAKKEGATLWWKVEDMLLFIEAVSGKKYPSDADQQEALKGALDLVNNPLEHPLLRDEKGSEYYIGNFPDALSHLLWILTSRDELFQALKEDGKYLLYFGKSETTAFLENVVPNVWLLLGGDGARHASKEELSTLFPLFFRCTKYLDQLHQTNFNIVKWYLRSILQLSEMDTIEDLLEGIETEFHTFQRSRGDIAASFKQALTNEQIRLTTKVNAASVGLYHYFNSLEPHLEKTQTQPFESLAVLPFTIWNNDFGLPHDFDEDSTQYIDEQNETIEHSEAERTGVFILSNYIRSLNRYDFLQLQNLRDNQTPVTEKKGIVHLEQLQGRIATHDGRLAELRRKSSQQNKITGHYTAPAPGNQVESEEQSKAEEPYSLDHSDLNKTLIEYFDSLEYTRVYLRDVMKDNEIYESLEPDFWHNIFKDTEKEWKILYSAYDQDTIVSFDSFVPKTIHPPKPSTAKQSSKKEDPYIKWFERSKHGMHHNHKKAAGIVQLLNGQLASRTLDATKPPVLFANSFVQSLLKDPYSSKNQLTTSMRWYAAFHYALNNGSKDKVCDIIDWYARELSRQLPYSDLTRDELKHWENKNHEWINALRNHFGCDKKEQSTIVHKQKRQKRRKVQPEREKQRKAEQRLQKEKASQRAAEKAKQRAAEEAKQRAAEEARQERVRQAIESDMGHINLHMGIVLAAIETLLKGDEKQALKKVPEVAEIYFSLFNATGNLGGTWFRFVTHCDSYIQGKKLVQSNDSADRALRCVHYALNKLGASQNQIKKWESEW